MSFPVKPWPVWMEERLLAKSADLGGESLARHTWDVLSRLADQFRLRPQLSMMLDEPRLWNRMFWACFLHDFGKTASGFQEILTGKRERWPYRHEVLSLAFVEWLFWPDHADYKPIVAVIASHHKDFDRIEYDYIHKSEETEAAINILIGEIDDETLVSLWRWLDECAEDWAAALGMESEVEMVRPIPLEQAKALFGRKPLKRALRRFADWFTDLDGTREVSGELLTAIHLRGLIFTADHSASGHADPFPALRLSRDHALGILQPEKLRDHQLSAEIMKAGSALLTAPTGSGKTEAALLWAASQLKQVTAPRLFYVLPYQASMNAMESRLKAHHFPSHVPVGLQHGRALQSIYHDLLTREDYTPQEAAQRAEAQKNLARLNYQPVRVFSPYEMLKAAYRLKGFEAQIVDYYGGLFIFDEIHAYEARRLALIVTFMKWLADFCRARFFVMTATLPPMVREVIQAALRGCVAVNATEKTFIESRRHRVHLLDGELLDEMGIEMVTKAVCSGKSVLVCLNTVKRAKEAYRLLSKRLRENSVKAEQILVHGRFNAEDRKKKEDAIIKGAEAGKENRLPMLVISTQVVEVSLNIDMDVLYSDPAPLEALLQRFGRVNRGHPPGSPLKDVFVFCQPIEFTHVYQTELVMGALAELDKINGQPIDEAQVNGILARVYDGEAGSRWMQEYLKSAEEFESAILSQIRPFQSADLFTFQEFNRLFDGVEVLPQCLEDDFRRRLKDDHEGGYISASSLLVPVSWGQYIQIHKAHRTVTPPDSDQWPKVVDVPYNSNSGLDLEAIKGLNRTDSQGEDY